MRAFIAIKINSGIRKKLEKIKKELNTLPIQAKWTAPENLHITLKFLGEIDQEKIVQVKKIMAETTRRQDSFDIYLENFGFFPNSSKPRIFFINSYSEQNLEKLSARLEEGLQKIGLSERKKFRAHITLARIKNPEKIKKLKEKIKSLNVGGKFRVNNIFLNSSTLTPKGPIYKEIFSSNLRN